MSLPTDPQVDASLAATRARVLEATHHVRSPKRSTRYRYTRNAIIAAGTVVVLTGGVLAVALAPRDIIVTTATCFDHASVDAHSQLVQSDDEPFNPLANCASEYPDNSRLSVCTLPDGTAGVFPREGRPGSDFCEALGLADWDSD
ncbi:hypothetical protein BH09ACT4_BH09ACT4_03240 [soil metagenome]